MQEFRKTALEARLGDAPRFLKLAGIAGAVVFGVSCAAFALPYLVAWNQAATSVVSVPEPFPVSVDPRTKTIRDDPATEALLNAQTSPFLASVGGATGVLSSLASVIDSSAWYRLLATSAVPRAVTILPGYRKEQVALVFGQALGWSKQDQSAFLSLVSSSTPPVLEGQFQPGTYAVEFGSSPQTVYELVQKRFDSQVLAHYPTSTEEIVPLSETLTIASMLEKETSDPSEMRVISGIIWNRLWSGMKLQIDATVQYAKANKTSVLNWWPAVHPADINIASPFNTYLHTGLPPSPIAEPSIAAVLAALNPKKTDCLYYFHDANSGFHCSQTYAEHVALLKKFYGRGK